MSEYQYYEFRAIDRPLDEAAMAALRKITSRAEITSTSLINEYHWGDFKGNPDKLMDKYFDAFLYFANWGTHRLMLRLPHGWLNPKTVKPYCVPDRVRAIQGAEHLVLDFSSAADCYEEEWRNWQLSAFLPLRADLMGSDMRCLYLAWLSAVGYGDVEDEELEPPVPPGLQSLSGPLTEFAEFLYLDDDLIAMAAEASAAALVGPSRGDMVAWVEALPEAEKNDWLVRVMQGEGSRLGAELLARFRRARAAPGDGDPGRERRTAKALLEAYETRRQKPGEEEAKRAARAREREEQEKAAARTKHLDELQGQEDKLWRQVDKLVGTKQPRKYDEAIALLKDLRDLSHRGTGMDFPESLRDLLVRHAAKTAFKRRLEQAGFAP